MGKGGDGGGGGGGTGAWVERKSEDWGVLLGRSADKMALAGQIHVE